MPKPCAFQCTNTPGSFKCVCPPGQQLLGDGKSCAGLERLPNYGAYYNSYSYAQFSPVRDNYQPQQYYRHSSNLYSSFSEYRNSRIPFSRTRRNIREPGPEGYEARNDRCVGKCQSYLCNSHVSVLILRLLFHRHQGLMVCGLFRVTLVNTQEFCMFSAPEHAVAKMFSDLLFVTSCFNCAAYSVFADRFPPLLSSDYSSSPL